MRTNEPRVYVVVLNWNNYDDTKACLESLERATYGNLEIVVVDNGSADGSGKRLQEKFPQHRFIFNERNIGFSRGCNAGIRETLKDAECSYVLLLNNDATVAPGFLEKAVATAQADDRIGLISGKIFRSLESKKLWYAGGEISMWRGRVNIRGRGTTDDGQYDKPAEVGFVTGAFLLIRREVLEKVGLLPEEYFFGVEEMDYSLQVRQSGYKLYYVPEFVAYHEGCASHWNSDPKFIYNGYRSKLIFQEKYLPRGLFPLWKLVFTIYAKCFARRFWVRAKALNGYDQDKDTPWNDMEFALWKAIADHRTNTLSDETLIWFESELRKRKLS
jgi:GT2 family glycosyltransferase